MTPLSVKLVGRGFAPVNAPLNPMSTEPPAWIAPFHGALVTVTAWPLCVYSPDQPLVTCWLPGNENVSVQELSALARVFVSLTDA